MLIWAQRNAILSSFLKRYTISKQEGKSPKIAQLLGSVLQTNVLLNKIDLIELSIVTHLAIS